MSSHHRNVSWLSQAVLAVIIVLRAVDAHAGGVTAIPCPGKAQAVIANTGQSFHNAGSSVTGNVQAAQSIVHNGGTIVGTQLAGTPAGLAVVPVPAGATNLGAFLLGSGTRNLTAGNYVASSFTMNANTTLTVSGGIVQIWVTGALVIGSGSRLNDGGSPQNLEFLVTGSQDAHENSNVVIFGLIYAPQAAVLIDSVIHGSVVGSRTTINSGGQVIFDPGSACPTCPDTQSDPNNCGACGNVCPPGNSCAKGVCTPPGACLPGSSTGVLVSGTAVDSFVPLGDWADGNGATRPNVRRVRLEGPATPSVTIPTPLTVNSCASNSATGVTVCTSNGTLSQKDVYLISGTTVTTLQSGALGTQSFSGGAPFNAGVAMDPVHNVAVLSIGLGTGAGAFQVVNLGASPVTLGAPIPTGSGITAEDAVIDSGRNLLFSPSESFTNHTLQVLDLSKSTVSTFVPPAIPAAGFLFDSAAEDCSTGIVLSSMEVTGSLFLANLAEATFTAPTWSAPSKFQSFPEFANPFLADGTNGLAVESGTHLGVVAGEFGGNGFGVIQLPATAVSGAPSVIDWVQANMPNPAPGVAWQMGRDPHTVTAYRSPITSKGLAVLSSGSGPGGAPPKNFQAVVDMAALLAAPRTAAGSHTVSPAVDLVASGIVTFIAL